METMDKKLKKTVVITLTVIVVFFSAVILLVWFRLPHELPLWLLFVLLLVPAGILIGTVAFMLRKLERASRQKKTPPDETGGGEKAP